jgi:uncharacterized protein YegP (UPF0339 family)
LFFLFSDCSTQTGTAAFSFGFTLLLERRKTEMTETGCWQQKYAKGQMVFIIQSKLYLRQAVVLRYSYGFYVIRFVDSNGGVCLRQSRLYGSKDAAQGVIARTKQEERIRYKDWMR